MKTIRRIWFTFYLILLSTVYTPIATLRENRGIERRNCHFTKLLSEITEGQIKLHKLREQMQIRATLEGPEIDAYIVTSFDEHLNREVSDHDKRLQYLTGFSGSNGLVAITLKRAAFWTNDNYLEQADAEIDCKWDIFPINGDINMTMWVTIHVPSNGRIGADPYTTPHYLWKEWNHIFQNKSLKLVKVIVNLIDYIWTTNRPSPSNITVKVHSIEYAGKSWQEKIQVIQEELQNLDCEAMIVTSLTEIAYILNIRARDIRYLPVVKGYLIIGRKDILLYTNTSKITDDVMTHLNAKLCPGHYCIEIHEYNEFWSTLWTYSFIWKRVLIPAPCIFDRGVSEAVYSTLPENITMEKVSPIIFMRAKKNRVEQQGMLNAHIKDGVAMCEALSNLERRFYKEKWTELKIKYAIELSRYSQKTSKGLSFQTVVTFGEHSSYPHYISSNVTDLEVTDKSTLIIESGGQYLEGTTDVSRTLHFGEPTKEQKQVYTRILASIINLSAFKFPANLKPSGIDAFSRSFIWAFLTDYPHPTGRGIGSYLSVAESPIDILYTKDEQLSLQPGYFLSNKPGFYKNGSFGIRLGNVLQVVDTGYYHSSGEKFLALDQVTLVPYEPKFIDRVLLSAEEKRMLNAYNAKLRDLIGTELKKQGNMRAFYWLMNKTIYMEEYLPKEEYRKRSRGSSFSFNFINLICFFFLVNFFEIIFEINIIDKNNVN